MNPKNRPNREVFLHFVLSLRAYLLLKAHVTLAPARIALEFALKNEPRQPLPTDVLPDSST